ncbi:MAG: HlyD family efflux transporter periplasmic adaptor subunit [Bacillota bacterium]
MARVRFKARFFVLTGVILAAAGIGLFFLLGGGREGELQTGTMRLNYNAKTVLVRDEVSVTTERYDKILFDVVEGAHVKEGDQIAQVFKWGYQEETMQTLLDVQKSIYDYQMNLIADIVNPDLDAVKLQIQQNQEAIRASARKETNGDMLTLEQELKELLSKRTEILKNIQPDEKLTGLYQQEEQQLSNLAAWKRDIINTVGDGIVSFYFDGYEQAISASKLNMLNADLIAGVLRGSGVATGIDTTTESPLYRLINGEHFYIAFLTGSSSAFRLVQGETYTVVFDGYSDMPFTGTALAPIVSAKQVVNILEFHQTMTDLMGVRMVGATIMKDVTGLTVPLDAIEMREGKPGILRVSGKEQVWTEIEVLAADDTEAVIRAAQSEQTLVEGLRYHKP